MCILQALGIEKSYGARTVLTFERLEVHEGDKIGIVGANGAGKSTLLGILSGEIAPDKGTVAIHRRAAFIRQVTVSGSILSGGEAAKERIAAETREEDEILFADEPTANLDEDGVRWVRQKLQSAGTVLLVSHDRALLDEICSRVIEVKDGRLKQYTGNYSDYERQVELERQRQQERHVEYRRKKKDLERALEIRERKGTSIVKAPRRMGNSEARLGKGKRTEKQKKQQRQAKVLERRLERLEPVDKAKEPPRLAIDFSLTDPPGNKNVITAEHLSFSYGERVILSDAGFVLPNRAKVALTGANGAGKTTLLRLIAEGHEAIRTAPKLRIGYLHQSFEELELDKTVLENAMATSVQDQKGVRGVLAGLLFRGDDVHKKAAVLSGGEKMRLCLARLIVSPVNALLLDEPTNFLDLPSLQAVQEVIAFYPGTVLLVSHDRTFIRHITQTEWRLENGKIRPQEQEKQQKSGGRMLLELRLAQLAGEISSAPPGEKERLEEEYHRTVETLQEKHSNLI